MTTHTTPMISATEAKHQLEAQSLLPGQADNMTRFLAKRAFSLLPIVQALHPDMKRSEAIHWVQTHAVHLVPEWEHTVADLYTPFGAHKTSSATVNPDILPMLGTSTKISYKIDAMEQAPHRSLRSLARKAGIDPDYAVQWAQTSRDRLADALLNGQLISFQNPHGTEDGKRLRDRFEVQLREQDAGAITDTKYSDAGQRFAIGQLIEHGFMRMAEDSTGKRDFLVTPAMEQLLSLPRVARLHKRTHYDMGAQTPESVLRFVEPTDAVEHGTDATPEDLLRQRYGATPPEPSRWREPPSFTARLGQETHAVSTHRR